jgi:hypothetical protein
MEKQGICAVKLIPDDDIMTLGLDFLQRYQAIFDIDGQSIGLIGPTRFTASYQLEQDTHQ